MPPPIVHTVYHPGAEGPLPTVIAIHGHGANGFDLLGLAPYIAQGRVLTLCPEASYVLQPGLLSFTWFDTVPPQQRSEREFERLPPEAETHADREALDALRMLVQHGSDDPMINVDRARDSRERLVALGVTPVYHEYAMAHEIRPESLSDLNGWLEEVLDLAPAHQPER